MSAPYVTDIDEIVKTEFKSFYLTKWMEEEIEKLIYFKIHENEYRSGTPYNVLLGGDVRKDVTELGNKITQKVAMYDIDNRVARTLTLDELIEMYPHFDDMNKNYSALLIDGIYEPQEEAVWKKLHEIFENTISIIKIVATNKETGNGFIYKDQDFFFRKVSQHIWLNDMTSDGIWERYSYYLQKSGKKMDEEFIDEMTSCLNTIYPVKVEKKGIDFISDLDNRVNRLLLRMAEVPKVLGKDCVPLYKKNGEVIEKEINPTYPKGIDSYISAHYSDDLFSSCNESKIDGVKKNANVALFALSTFYDKYEQSVLSSDDKEYRYFYQLEPALINERICYGKEKLDYVIMLCTDKTMEPKSIKVKVGNETYNMTMSPLEFIEELARKTSLLAPVLADDEGIIDLNQDKDSYISYYKKDDNINKRIIVVKIPKDNENNVKGENDNNARIISLTIKAIKQMMDMNHVNLHVYNNGGFRNTQSNLELIVSLLEKDTSISIKNYDVKYDGKVSAQIFEMGKDVVSFVSGMNEFRNYGKISSLTKYYDGQLKGKDSELLDCLKLISYGIQVNDINRFEEGLVGLYKVDEGNINDHYLRLFFSEIKEDFNFMNYRNDNREYVKRMVLWCLGKGYYQQVLTLIESRVPKVVRNLVKTGFENEIEELKNSEGYYYLSEDEWLLNKVVFRIYSIDTENKVLSWFNWEKSHMIPGKKFTNNENENKKKKKSYRYSVEISEGGNKDELVSFIRMHCVLKNKRNNANHADQSDEVNWELIINSKLNEFDLQKNDMNNKENNVK